MSGRGATEGGDGVVRLAYLVSHPIQYQAPLLRRIAREPDIDLTVFFGSDFSAGRYRDEGFGVDVEWDVSLLDGYKHGFLPALRRKGSGVVNAGIFSRLREGRFDVLWVHGYSTLMAMQGIVAARALGIPVLLRAESWLGDRPRGGWKRLAKRIFFIALRRMVDGVLPIGSLNAQYWRHYLGSEFPMSTMPYAVDNEYFQRKSAAAQAGREKLRAELGLAPGRPVILFAAKLQARKRCADLLKAYARLCAEDGPAGSEEGAAPCLLIVGDGAERARLEEISRKRGLAGVRFCGFRNQSELPRFFDLASVFVLPSEHEPWGLVVNEGMAAGLAVIVSNAVGCQPDLVTDGEEGCVYPAGDVAALERALRRVLTTPGTAEEMGRRGLERIARWSFEEDVHGLREAVARATGKIAARSMPARVGRSASP